MCWYATNVLGFVYKKFGGYKGQRFNGRRTGICITKENIKRFYYWVKGAG